MSSKSNKTLNPSQRRLTEENIRHVIEVLKFQGRRVTKAEVSRRTGLHRKTLEKHYNYLFMDV